MSAARDDVITARVLALRDAGWPITRIGRRLRRENRGISRILKAVGQPPRIGSNKRLRRNPDLQVKKCSDCRDELPLVTEFYKNRTRSDGYCEHCRECQKGRQRDHYARKSEERRAGVHRQQLCAPERRLRGGRPQSAYDLEVETAPDTDAMADLLMMEQTPFLEQPGPMSVVSIYGVAWRRGSLP